MRRPEGFGARLALITEALAAISAGAVKGTWCRAIPPVTPTRAVDAVFVCVTSTACPMVIEERDLVFPADAPRAQCDSQLYCRLDQGTLRRCEPDRPAFNSAFTSPIITHLLRPGHQRHQGDRQGRALVEEGG